MTTKRNVFNSFFLVMVYGDHTDVHTHTHTSPRTGTRAHTHTHDSRHSTHHIGPGYLGIDCA